MTSRSTATRFVAGTALLGIVSIGQVAQPAAAVAAPRPSPQAAAADYGAPVTVNVGYNRNSRVVTVNVGPRNGKVRGTVKVSVAGRTYSLTVHGGKALIKLPKGTKPGRYQVKVTYRAPDGKTRTVTTTIIVTKSGRSVQQGSFNSYIPPRGGDGNGSGGGSGRDGGDGRAGAGASGNRSGGGGSGGGALVGGVIESSTGGGAAGANRAPVSGAVDSGLVDASRGVGSGTLADTGASTQTELLALVGLGLLGAGGTSIVVARRRSRVPA